MADIVLLPIGEWKIEPAPKGKSDTFRVSLFTVDGERAWTEMPINSFKPMLGRPIDWEKLIAETGSSVKVDVDAKNG